MTFYRMRYSLGGNHHMEFGNFDTPEEAHEWWAEMTRDEPPDAPSDWIVERVDDVNGFASIKVVAQSEISAD